MKITRESIITGKIRTMDIDVTPIQIAAWRAGGLIQDVMPDISVEEREFIINGVTQEEWDTYFSEEEE